MKKIIFGLIFLGFIGYLIFAPDTKQNNPGDSYNADTYSNLNLFTSDYNDYDTGYEWAENNGIEDFLDCDNEFGYGSEAEDGCNEYVQENQYNETPTFSGYDCTEDCSGHEAGYDWAEENDVDSCGGNSNSFIEGCEEYLEQQEMSEYEEDNYYENNY